MTAGRAPVLSTDEIKERLEELYRYDHRSHLVALFGVGHAGQVATRAAGTFRVEPTAHEAELRRKLPGLEDEDPRIVFLVDWAGQLPLDVQGRFALSGRVLQVGKPLRLRRMFGLPDREDAVDAGVYGSALAEHLLRTGTPPRMAVAGGRLTLAELWSAWLHTNWGVPTEAGLSLDLLLGWAALRADGASFGEALPGESCKAVRAELLAEIEARVGPTGRLIWKAWEEGRGGRVLELAILGEAVAKAQDDQLLSAAESGAIDVWCAMKVEHDLGLRVEPDTARRHIRELGQAAGGALRWIERTSGDALAVAHRLAGAEARLDPIVRPCVGASPRLPVAWGARLATLGTALKEAAARPCSVTVDAARETLFRLEQHERFKLPEARTTVERAWMALRLAGWLATRNDRGATAPETSWAQVGRLARWYAEEGGYVDRARRQARGEATGAFGEGVQAVVGAADAVREELDRAFAAALPEWLRAGRPSHDVLPIDQAADRFVAGFLKERGEDEHGDRRLLVVLLDGMAWGQAVEILESLNEMGSPWGLVAWTSKKGVRVGAGLHPPILAALPTMTETSRSAFFAGALMEPGRSHRTGDDPARWAKHRTVKPFLDPHDATPVKLRGEASTADGAADGDVLARIRDGSPGGRLVTVVLNAIDSSLKADAQQRTRWSVDTVKALRALLEAAQEAGRFVLLASDHGHVPADRLRTETAPTAPEGGRRWRPLLDDGEVAPYEIALPAGPGVWTPKGAKGVVLLADDAHRYGASIASGEHGGATLAEVVAPLVLLAPVITHPAPSARELAVSGPPVPRFWLGLVEGPAVEPVSAARPPPPKRRHSPPQLSLPTLGRPVPPEPTPAPQPPPRREPRLRPLAESALFQAATKARPDVDAGRLLEALELTLARDGRAPVGLLAEALRQPAFRMRSFASRATEIMNVDGYPVLRLDGDTLHLDVQLLEQVFEVRL